MVLHPGDAGHDEGKEEADADDDAIADALRQDCCARHCVSMRAEWWKGLVLGDAGSSQLGANSVVLFKSGLPNNPIAREGLHVSSCYQHDTEISPVGCRLQIPVPNLDVCSGQSHSLFS